MPATSSNTSDPSVFQAVTAPAGFRAAAAVCGIKRSGSSDLALIVADEPCAAAALFTRNRMPGAPVIVGKRHVRNGRLQAIVVNSGVSNVCTGAQGVADAVAMCKAVSQACPGVAFRNVLPSSTGIIGVPLPMDKLLPGIAHAAARLDRGSEADAVAARAIMTTDLVAKYAVRRMTLGGRKVTLGAMAKGSGMIQPNMATMLAFITTDAAIDPPILKRCLQTATAETFNRISVDHDTSTSDTVVLLASGNAGNPLVRRGGADEQAFRSALTDLCHDLAHQIVRDGEGATRVFRVRVLGARSHRDADRVGYTVVGSPLIKCAVHGADANWGRLVAAVGRSGAMVRPEKLSISIGNVVMGERGQPVALDAQQRKVVEGLMKAREIIFTIDLGVGRAETQWLGCDLSAAYVAINGDYTT